MLRLPFIAAAGSMLILAACSSIETIDTSFGSALGTAPPPPPAAGLVVGDEPYAVHAGATVLSTGGSAVDAATAMYFALAVTYPVAAGIGGGGVCVVHDPATGKNESFGFLPREAASGGTYAVPGNVAGFTLMQSLYGRVPWQRDVSSGEEMAATGFPISRALSARLIASQGVIRLDAGLSAEFLNESGQVKPVGVIVSNPELAQTLSAVRMQRGPLGFYTGDIAQKISSYASGEGGGLSASDLSAYRASESPAHGAPLGSYIAYLSPANLAAGKFANALLSRVIDAQGQAGGDNPAAAIAAATKQTLDGFGITTLPQDLGATGFAATDLSGEAIACGVTMNGPFGSGHTAKGTGVTLAKAPSSGDAGLSAAFLTPVVATDSSGAVALAGVGAGGPNGTAATVYALARLARNDEVTRPSEIHSTGLAPFDTVNVIACQDGTCAVLPDSGANGLGIAVSNDPQD